MELLTQQSFWSKSSNVGLNVGIDSLLLTFKRLLLFFWILPWARCLPLQKSGCHGNDSAVNKSRNSVLLPRSRTSSLKNCCHAEILGSRSVSVSVSLWFTSKIFACLHLVMMLHRWWIFLDYSAHWLVLIGNFVALMTLTSSDYSSSATGWHFWSSVKFSDPY